MQGRRRHALLLAAAMRKAAADPDGTPTRGRADLLPGIRSLHLRHARGRNRTEDVKNPARVLYYREVAPGLIEIVRVLHERMDPVLHVGTGAADPD